MTRERRKTAKVSRDFLGKALPRRSARSLSLWKCLYPTEERSIHWRRNLSPQLAFDFSKDPEPGNLVPLVCHLCSPDDLHLVEVKNEKHYASILCGDCRTKERGFIDTAFLSPCDTRGPEAGLEMKNIKKEMQRSQIMRLS